MFALMIGLVFLWGCSSSSANEEAYKQFQSDLCAASSIEMTVDLTASYNEKVLEYKLFFMEDGDKATVEVLSPKLIAGVKAHILPGKDSLEYDGMILDAVELTEDGLTPLSALPAMLECMKNGYVTQIWSEELSGQKIIAIQSPISDEAYLTLWLAKDSMTPLHCEITNADKVVIFCNIAEWTINRG